jgi:hypothetical protein
MSTDRVLHCNRSRDCNGCKRRGYRVLVAWPKPDDPDYTGALCPTCDMNVGNLEKRIR